MYGLAMVKGLMVTLKNLTKKPFTVQYPEERLKQHPRFRGEEFVWYEERCTGCASCAKYCPLGIIEIVTSPSETAPAEGDKYRLEVFDIAINRCMFCGLCVEACPYDALFMGSGFEQGRYSRKDMVITIDQLRQAEKRPSTFFRPAVGRPGLRSPVRAALGLGRGGPRVVAVAPTGEGRYADRPAQPGDSQSNGAPALPPAAPSQSGGPE